MPNRITPFVETSVLGSCVPQWRCRHDWRKAVGSSRRGSGVQRLITITDPVKGFSGIYRLG